MVGNRNAYRSHLVAVDFDDDRKICKAEKLAKEHMATKRKPKFNRRGGFKRRPFYRNWQSRGNYNPQYRDGSYRSPGSGRSLDDAERTTYYPNRRQSSSISLRFLRKYVLRKTSEGKGFSLYLYLVVTPYMLYHKISLCHVVVMWRGNDCIMLFLFYEMYFTISLLVYIYITFYMN